MRKREYRTVRKVRKDRGVSTEHVLRFRLPDTLDKHVDRELDVHLVVLAQVGNVRVLLARVDEAQLLPAMALEELLQLQLLAEVRVQPGDNHRDARSPRSRELFYPLSRLHLGKRHPHYVAEPLRRARLGVPSTSQFTLGIDHFSTLGRERGAELRAALAQLERREALSAPEL